MRHLVTSWSHTAQPHFRVINDPGEGLAVQAKVLRVATRWWLWDRIEYSWAPVYVEVRDGYHVRMSGYTSIPEGLAHVRKYLEAGDARALLLAKDGLQPVYSEPL